MVVLFLFAMSYFVIPESIQVFLDSKKIPIFPEGTLKAILFLTASYCIVSVVDFLYVKFVQLVNTISSNNQRKSKIALIESYIDHLSGDELDVVSEFIINEFRRVDLNSINPVVLNLVEKGIIEQRQSLLIGSSHNFYYLTPIAEAHIKKQIINQSMQ